MSGALEYVGAAYDLGGSVASSLQATARSINDIDFVVELRPAQVPDFKRELVLRGAPVEGRAIHLIDGPVTG